VIFGGDGWVREGAELSMVGAVQSGNWVWDKEPHP
jgi:hypothetical protein